METIYKAAAWIGGITIVTIAGFYAFFYEPAKSSTPRQKPAATAPTGAIGPAAPTIDEKVTPEPDVPEGKKPDYRPQPTPTPVPAPAPFYANLDTLELKIFTEGITPEEFTLMTTAADSPFAKLHETYQGDPNKVLQDPLFANHTAAWYAGRTVNPEINGWTLWANSQATSKALGDTTDTRLLLLYLTALNRQLAHKGEIK